MPLFPSTETLLQALHQSAGLATMVKTTEKHKLQRGELSLDTFAKIGELYLSELFEALDMDDIDRRYALRHWLSYGNFHKSVELHTWTQAATSAEITWQVGSLLLAPALGRYLALWDMDKPLPPETPANWFLPTVNVESGSVELPVPKVLSRFLQQRGLSVQALADTLTKHGGEGDDPTSTAAKNLHQWLNGRLPDVAVIRTLFSDKAGHPSEMRRARQRLSVARMCQDAYKRLCKLLGSEKVNQLLDIYRRSFDLTLLARQACFGQGQRAEDAWFEAHLTAQERRTTFRCVTPSTMFTAAQTVGAMLTAAFSRVGVDASLAPLAGNATAKPDSTDEVRRQLDEVLALLQAASTPNTQGRVEAALQQLRALPEASTWAASIDHLRARHLLRQNRFDDALKAYREALDRTLEQSCGPLRGQLAVQGWGAELAMSGRFVPDNHQRWHRHALAFNAFGNDMPGIADAAVAAEATFWRDLYRPYPGLTAILSPGHIEGEAMLQEAIALSIRGDTADLACWLAKHRKALANARLKDVRGDTLLLRWMKAPANLRMPDIVATNWRQAIRQVINTWRKQVNMHDFKRQTPLMLAADEGDAELVDWLLSAGADVNHQDYLGRTPLHAAATGGDADSVELITSRGADLLLATFDEGQTALHTAAMMGRHHVVEKLIRIAPSLTQVQNADGQTPRQIGTAIVSNYDAHATWLRDQGRDAPPLNDYHMVVAWLA